MNARLTLKNKVGPWVMGNDFWNREDEVSRLIELLDGGESILLVAPRRVGKTSLLRETVRRLGKREHDHGLYIDVQDCSTPEDVVVALSLATRSLHGLWRKVLDLFKATLGDLPERVESVGNDWFQIKFREGLVGDWRAKGDRLFAELAKGDRPLVVCIDELPVMLVRLLYAEGDPVTARCRRSAEAFLSWLRKNALAHQERVRLVICGSIGIETVARSFGLSGSLAHLRAFHLSPWPVEVAEGCLSALASHYGVELAPRVSRAMTDQLGCCIPHHVQMFFGHILEACRSNRNMIPTVEDVRRVYEESMLGTRGHAELADYEERLLRVIGKDLQPLALELLTEAAVAGVLTAQAAFILARGLGFEDPAAQNAVRSVLEVLEHDGYLQRSAEGDRFEFVSKLVRDWWKRQICFLTAEKRGA